MQEIWCVLNVGWWSETGKYIYPFLLGHLKLILCFVPEYFPISMRAREKHNTDCEKNADLFTLNKVNLDLIH